MFQRLIAQVMKNQDYKVSNITGQNIKTRVTVDYWINQKIKKEQNNLHISSKFLLFFSIFVWRFGGVDIFISGDPVLVSNFFFADFKISSRTFLSFAFTSSNKSHLLQQFFDFEVEQLQ